MALAAIIGFGAAACSDDDDYFTGTWVAQQGQDAMRLVCKDKSWSLSIDGEAIYKGAYLAYSDVGTLTITHVMSDTGWKAYSDLNYQQQQQLPEVIDIRINGNQITVMNVGSNGAGIVFTKQ
jgi:hypothetical protein